MCVHACLCVCKLCYMKTCVEICISGEVIISADMVEALTVLSIPVLTLKPEPSARSQQGRTRP